MKTKIKKILITGSSGMIGTRLFEILLSKGYKVIGFDKRPNDWQKNLNRFTVIGNLLNKNDIKKIPSDVDLIVHLAANARVYDLVVNPDLALENIISTYNILNFVRENKINRIIFSSSREVYSNRKKIVAKEDDVVLSLCESAYSASKISDEVLTYSFSKCYGIDYIICRFSNVYGMYDTSNRFVPLLVRDMIDDKNIEIFGKDKVLDFTYIDDCVGGVIKCIEKFDKSKNNVFNIASGKGSNLKDVATLIKKKMGSQSKISIGKNRTGEVVKYIADISRAKKVLNYKPQITLQKGLDLSVNWYKNNVLSKN
jgi:nucleoside-diphosphate-sugar epimerase